MSKGREPHAANKKGPVIDLLPRLFQKMKEQGIKPKDYFLDWGQLSPLGNEIVSQFILDFIQTERLVTNGEEDDKNSL